MKLKLRVAVISSTSAFEPKKIPSPPVTSGKREASTLQQPNATLVHRQFLLMVPVECTFAHLKGLLRSHYDKIYASESNFVPLRRIVKFRDELQCDLDDDFVVSEICEPGTLIFAIAELDFHYSKKAKVVVKPQSPRKVAPVPAFKTKEEKPVKLEVEREAKCELDSIDSESPVELTEANATVLPAPTSETVTEVQIEPQTTHAEAQSFKKPNETQSNQKRTEPQPIKKPGGAQIIKKPSEAQPIKNPGEIQPVKKPTEVKVNTQVQPPHPVHKPIESQPIKKPVEISQPVKKPVEVPQPVKKPIEISQTVKKPAKIARSVVESSSELVSEPVENPPVTPCPSPSATFIPRKSSSFQESSSEDDDDEKVKEDSSVYGFELPSIVVAQPKRTEVILFAADSSSEDEASFESVRKESPVPDPSVIPSLAEVVESLDRAPTPLRRGRPKKPE